ncbi:MAG: hypothetical protein M3Y57_19800 [Acidobacteriota bacterium]|nr:hypothetical protein [Acidobacteriota bacterium]
MNPGGLFGPVTVDLLGREGISSTRNSTLLRLLEDITPIGERRAVCEKRGSGVGAMLAALSNAGLRKPEFDNRISSFKLTLFNDSIAASAVAGILRRRDRRDEILAILRNRGDLSRADIGKEMGLADSATRKWLALLRKEGKIATTEPARSKNVRYRVST